MTRLLSMCLSSARGKAASSDAIQYNTRVFIFRRTLCDATKQLFYDGVSYHTFATRKCANQDVFQSDALPLLHVFRFRARRASPRCCRLTVPCRFWLRTPLILPGIVFALVRCNSSAVGGGGVAVVFNVMLYT